MLPQPPIVNQVRYILIIFSVFLFSLTVISCKSSDDDITSSTSSTGLFVTVGDNGIMLTSSDGISWTKRTSVTTNSLGAVKFLPSLTDISCSKKDDSSSSSSADGLPGTYQLATNDYANGVATDSSGNVYVAGGTYGGLDGNTSAGNADLFVVKYNSSGTKQ